MKERYSELISGENTFSSDNLNAVIRAALEDYENGESNGEDIEILDNETQEIIWTTAENTK